MAGTERERGADAGEIATSTLAEIYARQGLLERALAMYRRIALRAPEDPAIQARIGALTEQLEALRAGDAGPTIAIPVEGDLREAGEAPHVEPARSSAGDETGELEALAARTGPPETPAGKPGDDAPDTEFLAWLNSR
ncbi:MAG: hypothetical protein ABR559_03580 [Gemmatimonadota bacterium]